jgi:hypothetical protein
MRQFAKLTAAGLLVLSATQPLHASETHLEVRALEALFPGRFTAVVHGYTVSFKAHYDGTLVGHHGSETDTGRWSIVQGELCIMLSTWLNGRTNCARVVRDGEWYRAGRVHFRKGQ